MRANYLLDIQEQKTAEDPDSDPTDYANETEEWVTVTQTFAEIVPLRGRELADAQQVHAEVTHKIRIPWVSTFNAYYRLFWPYQSRVFHPLGPPLNEKEKNRRLVLMCAERK